MNTNHAREQIDLPKITFVAGGRTFDRLFKEDTLQALHATVKRKLNLSANSTLQLHQLRDGVRVDLEDEEDFQALYGIAHTDRAARLRIEVDVNLIPSDPDAENPPRKRRKLDATKETIVEVVVNKRKQPQATKPVVNGEAEEHVIESVEDTVTPPPKQKKIKKRKPKEPEVDSRPEQAADAEAAKEVAAPTSGAKPKARVTAKSKSSAKTDTREGKSSEDNTTVGDGDGLPTNLDGVAVNGTMLQDQPSKQGKQRKSTKKILPPEAQDKTKQAEQRGGSKTAEDASLAIARFVSNLTASARSSGQADSPASNEAESPPAQRKKKGPQGKQSSSGGPGEMAAANSNVDSNSVADQPSNKSNPKDTVLNISDTDSSNNSEKISSNPSDRQLEDDPELHFLIHGPRSHLKLDDVLNGIQSSDSGEEVLETDTEETRRQSRYSYRFDQNSSEEARSDTSEDMPPDQIAIQHSSAPPVSNGDLGAEESTTVSPEIHSNPPSMTTDASGKGSPTIAIAISPSQLPRKPTTPNTVRRMRDRSGHIAPKPTVTQKSPSPAPVGRRTRASAKLADQQTVPDESLTTWTILPCERTPEPSGVDTSSMMVDEIHPSTPSADQKQNGTDYVPETPLFLQSQPPLPYPYSQFQQSLEAENEHFEDSNSDADEEEVEAAVATSIAISVPPRFPRLSDFGGRQNFPRTVRSRPMPVRPSFSTDMLVDDDDDDTSSDGSEPEQKSHIPHERRAGLRSARKK